MVHHSAIKVLSTKMSISSSGFHIKAIVFECEERNIESSTTEVKDEHISFSNIIFSLLKSICKSSSSRFIDYPHYIKASNSTSIFCGFSLRIVEISRNGNHCVLDR